jgi:hypothetical protein
MFLGNKKPHFKILTFKERFSLKLLVYTQEESKSFFHIVIQINFRSGLGGESSGTTRDTVLLAYITQSNDKFNFPKIILLSEFFCVVCHNAVCKSGKLIISSQR